MKKSSVALMVLLIFCFLAACGGGGASSGPLITVGGVVSGLTGTLVLQNNGGDDLTVTANGSFIFPTPLAPGSSYTATVRTHPAFQTCLVSNGTGTILILNVTNISVDCSKRGGLDVTFNAPSGFAVQSNVTGSYADDSGNAVIIDSLGKILVTGSSGTNSAGNTDMVVWRYNADGTLDPTFNVSGFVVQDSPAGAGADDAGKALAIDSEGRILVTGSSGTTGNTDMVVWRYNADGTPDTTFGAMGVLSTAGAAGGDSGNGIVSYQGKILVAGSTAVSAGNSDMALWQFNANGTLDSDFGGGDGMVVHDNAAGGFGNDFGKAVVVDPQGRILVAGSSRSTTGNMDMVLWRFTSKGTLDTTFNSTKGCVHINATGAGDNSGNAVAIDSLGRILVAGSSRNSLGNTDMVLWRFTQSGTLDTTFSGDGMVINNGAAGSNGDDSGNGIAIDSRGRILVSGSSTNSSGNTDMAVWRFATTGDLDTTFAVGGIAVHNNAAGGNGNDFGSAVAVDSQDRILVAGSSRNSAGNSDMVLWRVFP